MTFQIFAFSSLNAVIQYFHFNDIYLLTCRLTRTNKLKEKSEVIFENRFA